MAKRKESPQKAAMREMMHDYLKNNDISIKDGTDVNSIMRDIAFCGAQRTPMRFRADVVQSITDALKRLLLSVSFWAGSLQCSVSLPVSVSHWLILRH